MNLKMHCVAANYGTHFEVINESDIFIYKRICKEILEMQKKKKLKINKNIFNSVYTKNMSATITQI